MGIVYKARDRRLNRIVALKFPMPNRDGGPAALARFQREAEAIAALNHPAIATIYEVGTWGDEPFIALEFLPGGTLKDRRHDELFDLPKLLSLASQLGSGLAYAHSKGILHRDIKPGNCMFSALGSLKLVDFGLAKSAGFDDITRPGSTLGTLPYMAPELLLGEPASVRSDLYALGVVIYEMAAGRVMFGNSQEILQGAATPLQVLRPDLPTEFCATVARATALRAADRQQSVEVFLDQLKSGAPALTETIEIQTPARSRRPAKWLVPLLALGTIATSGIVVSRWKGVPRHETVVVLPFENIGDDPTAGNAANKAMAEGLQETVASLLSSAPELRSRMLIIPSSEVRRSQVKSIAEARKLFNCTLALTGTTQRSAENIRLTLHLADARELREKDSRILNVQATKTAALQGELAETLGSLFGANTLSSSMAGMTSNSTAYDLFLQGRGALEGRQLDEAISFLTKAVQTDPGFSTARAKLAEAYLRQYLATHETRWLGMADTEVEKAASGGHTPEVSMAQGLIRKSTGDTKAAIELFQEVLKADPANMEALRFLAESLDAAGKVAEAEATYQQGLRIHPGYWPFYQSLGLFYAQHKRYREAEQTYLAGLEFARESPAMHYNLGALYFQESRWAEAGREFEASVRIKPNAIAYANLGTVRFFEGNYLEAAKQTELATKLQPANEVNWGNLGDALWQLEGKRDEARAAFEKAAALASKQLMINPENAQMRKRYALYLAKLGRSEEAVREIRKAANHAPKDENVQFYAARVFTVAGDKEAGISAVLKSLALGLPLKEVQQEPDLRPLEKDPRFPHTK